MNEVAEVVLAGIASLLATYSKAKSGAITPEQALAEIPSFTASEAADDAAADATVAKRFP